MRKILLTAIVAMLTMNLFAQIKVSARLGFSNAWVQSDSVFFNQDDTLTLSDLRGGYHFGLAAQLKVKKFFVQSEILFNTNTAEFALSAPGAKSALRERFNNVDIPVIFGYKTGSFRIGAGPVGHVFVSNKTDLFQRDGFSDAFENMTFGYQAGIGLDLWKIQIDVKYEGNMNDFDSFINLDDSNVSFANSPQRMVFTVGYIF